LQFGFVIFWQKNIGKKAAQKMLLKLLKVSILSTFYTCLLRQNFGPKKLQSQNVTREKLRLALLYEIFGRKMLMKLTKGLRPTCLCSNLFKLGTIVHGNGFLKIRC